MTQTGGFAAPDAQEPGAPAAEKEAGARCRILETAERLFRELGLAKTTVADIARDLRMSPANIYRFFASKSAIQEAVAANVVGELERFARAFASAPAPAGERLRLIVRATETYNRERLTQDRKMHEMVETALAERWPIIESHIRSMREIYAGIIAEGMAGGEFAPGDPHQAAGLLQAAVIAYCHPRLMVECADFDTPPSDAMLNLLLRGLGEDRR